MQLVVLRAQMLTSAKTFCFRGVLLRLRLLSLHFPVWRRAGHRAAVIGSLHLTHTRGNKSCRGDEVSVFEPTAAELSANTPEGAADEIFSCSAS